MSSSYRNTAVGATVLALLLGAQAASAQAWIFDPRVEVEAIYNDNNRLTDQPGEEIEVTGGGLDAQVTARKQGAASLFELTPRVHSTFFPSESDEESTDYYADLKTEKRTQRTRTGVGARFADESVVTSELLEADFPGVGLGDPVSGDAGRVSVRNRRRLAGVTPTFDFDWTERRHLALQAHYVDVTYQNDTLFEQVGYTDIGGAAGMGFDLTQRSTLSVDLVGSRYSPDNDTEDTTSTGVVAEWRMSPSQVTNFYFRLGSNRSKRDAHGTTPSSSTSSFNGGVGVAWNFQVTNVVIDALRTTVPSSQGEVVDRDELRFRLTRSFSPRVAGFVALRGIKTNGVDDTTTGVQGRKYYTGRTGFEWRTTRAFSLEGAYEYKWQEYESEPNKAKSNGITLSVVYEPHRLN
jgi:hypothetical protein